MGPSSRLVPLSDYRPTGPTVLAIMDGVGIGRGDAGDAVFHAQTPFLDALKKSPLYRTLRAHGTAVGMPSDGDMGNSEVGHNAIGAGRVFDQGAKRVAEAIASGALFKGDTWRKLTRQLVHHRRALHLIGLLSDGNVHSHIDHLLALVARAHADGVETLYIHVLLDGRDVAPKSALGYLARLEAHLAPLRHLGRRYRVASGGGRMQLTMDRYEADWEMVARGYKHHALGEGRQFPDAMTAVTTLREEGPSLTDQDLPGFVVAEQGRAVGAMQKGDGVIAFNFRGDRMLELTRVFEDETFTAFERGPKLAVTFAAMTQYDAEAKRPQLFLVSPSPIDNTLGELLAEAKMPQFASSETQKFGHVTYFFNGNRSGMFDAHTEVYHEVPSLAGPFEAAPAMQADAIVAATCAHLQKMPKGLCRINLANGDMVGHTGNLAATIQAVEAVDRALSLLARTVLSMGGTLVVTADHGNAEEMFALHPATGDLLLDAQGQPRIKTAHSLNPVPFGVLMPQDSLASFALTEAPEAGLAHVAATLCLLLGYHPASMFCSSLLKRR